MSYETTRNIACASLRLATAALTLPALSMGIPRLIARHAKVFPSAKTGQTAREVSEATQAEALAHSRQAREKYPEHPRNTHHDWLRAATEELGECSKTIHNGGMTQEEMYQLREEVLQLAATALNWADCADFSPTKPGQRA